MITMYPVIIPTVANSNKDTSLVQECIEAEGNSDILKKFISQEELSEEEKDRIVECVEDKRATSNTAAGVFIAIVILIVIATIALVVWSFLTV